MTEGPATVGSLKSQGYKTIMAFCEAVDCSHSAPVPLDGLPDGLGIPDVAKRLKCAACGSKRIRYEGAFAIIKDERGNETAIPAEDIAEVKTEERGYW